MRCVPAGNEGKEASVASEEERWEEVFRKAEVPDPDPAFLDRLEQDLRSASGKGTPAVSEPGKKWRGDRFGFAVAAAVVLVVSGTIFMSMQEEARRRQESQTVIQPTPPSGGEQPPSGGGKAVRGIQGGRAGGGMGEALHDKPFEGKETPEGPLDRLERDPIRGRGGPAVQAKAVPVRFSEPRKMKEKSLSLMERIHHADVIVTGQFAEGGHGNIFLIEAVLKGKEDRAVVSLLTDTGFVCPKSATALTGAWAVAFGAVRGNRIEIRSSQWLKQFRDPSAYKAFAEKVRSYLGGEAVMVVLKQLRNVMQEEAAGEAGPRGGKGLSVEQQQKFQKALMRIMMQFGPQGPEKIRDEIEKFLEKEGPAARKWFQESMGRNRKEKKEDPRWAIPKLVRDLELLGGLEAVAGLMELYIHCKPTEVNARVLMGLANIPLGEEGSSPADLKGLVGGLKELPAAGEGKLSPEEVEKLKERLRELMGKGGPAPSSKEPKEEGLSAAKRKAIGELLPVLDRALGSLLPTPLLLDEANLRKAAQTLRKALLRKVALDASGHVEHRTTALEAQLKRAPDAISPAEIVALTGDGSLPYLIRLRAVKLCGVRKLKEAVPALVQILRDVDVQSQGPAPVKGYAYSTVSGFSLNAEALRAIGAIGEPSPISDLLVLLKAPAQPGSSLKSWIAETLAELKATEAIPALEEALADEAGVDAFDRKGIRRALERLKAQKKK
jgi:hypothetical protein